MKIGVCSFIDPGASVDSTATIGDYVSIHNGASIGRGSVISGFTQVWSSVSIREDVVIESHVVIKNCASNDSRTTIFHGGAVIGAGSVIHHGVSIGEGAVVKPGSVVEQDIPPYAIVSGFPARAVGYVENVGSKNSSPWHLQASFPSVPAISRLGVGDVTLHRLKTVCDPRGDLTVGEFPSDIPFEPKRYFLVFNVPSEKTRGEHAHRQCHQFLICVRGSCAVVVDDGSARCEVQLNSPDMGLYLPPLTWGIQYKYSSDAVLLVFTSDYYDANDYIRDYSEFVEIAHSQYKSERS